MTLGPLERTDRIHARDLVPTEEQEMETLAAWLDLHRILWFHPANEGHHKPQWRAKMAKLGLKPGVPDCIIIDRVPKFPQVRGVAIELKRRKGGRVSEQQDRWLGDMALRGWFAADCRGADAAIELLEQLGFGQRKAG